MVSQQEFENRLTIFKKVFHRRCLFCEQVIEDTYSSSSRPTLLSTCEFCFPRYQVLKEGKELNTIGTLFRYKCYFCRETCKESYSYTEGVKYCRLCAARYELLRELEKQKEQIK